MSTKYYRTDIGVGSGFRRTEVGADVPRSSPGIRVPDITQQGIVIGRERPEEFAFFIQFVSNGFVAVRGQNGQVEVIVPEEPRTPLLLFSVLIDLDAAKDDTRIRGHLLHVLNRRRRRTAPDQE